MKNPLREIKNDQSYTLNEFAIACDISRSSICDLINGEKKAIPESVTDTLEILGYDKSELREKYQDFREQKRRELLT